MTFWVIRCNDYFYRFDSSPDLADFPYYSEIKNILGEDEYYLDDTLSETCYEYWDEDTFPGFLELDSLKDKEIKKIDLFVLPSDNTKNDALNKELKSLDSDILQYLWEEVSKIANKPYVSNKSELTPEEIRKFLVTNSTDILSKLADGGLHPLKCLFEALDSKDIYSILGSSCTLYSDIKYNILKDMPIQDLAQFIGNFEQKNIEDLSKYLPTSVVATINNQQIKSISNLIDIVKKLTSYEIESVVSMLPMDKIELFKKAVDAKIKCNPSNVKGKTSLVDKLKNNKLI